VVLCCESSGRAVGFGHILSLLSIRLLKLFLVLQPGSQLTNVIVRLLLSLPHLSYLLVLQHLLEVFLVLKQGTFRRFTSVLTDDLFLISCNLLSTGEL